MIATTNRLNLSEIALVDAPFAYDLLNSPTWIEFIGDRKIKTIDDARNYILTRFMKSYEEFGFGLWLVTLKEHGTPIGICGLVKRPSLEHVDIGFAFLPEYGGQGYGFEAATATMNYAQNTLGLKRIVAITIAENKRSIALLEKIGLRFEKTIRIAEDSEELMLFATVC